MGILFGHGPYDQRVKNAVKMALTHGCLLACFALVYKAVCCVLRRLFQTNSSGVSFFAGLIGSQMYFVH